METEWLQLEDYSSFDEIDDDAGSQECSEDKETALNQVIESSEIDLKIQQYIQDVQDETGLDRSVAISLLIKNSWNPEILIKNFQYGYIEYPEKNNSHQNEICPFCLNPPSNPVILDCNHLVCTECFKTLLKLHLQNGSSILLAKCPQAYCDYPLDDLVFATLLTEEEFQTYQNCLKHSFISSCKTIKKCDFEDCKFFVDVKSVNAKVYTCGCFRECCIECAKESHRPLSCAQFNFFSQKMELKEIEFSKSCPSCYSLVNLSNINSEDLEYICPCGYNFCIKCLNYYKYHNSNHCSEIYDDRFKINFINQKLENENDVGRKREIIVDLGKLYEKISKETNNQVFINYSKINEKFNNSDQILKNFAKIYKGVGLLYVCLYEMVFVLPRFEFLKFQIESVVENVKKLEEDIKFFDFKQSGKIDYHFTQPERNILIKVQQILDYLEKIYESIENDQLYNIKDFSYVDN